MLQLGSASRWWAGMCVAVALGCGPEAPAPPAPAQTPAEAPPSAPVPAPAPAPLPEPPAPVVPAGTCERARACCAAFVAVLPGPAGTEDPCQTLELVIEGGGAAADEGCLGALEGFRRSLAATGHDVPPTCAE